MVYRESREIIVCTKGIPLAEATSETFLMSRSKIITLSRTKEVERQKLPITTTSIQSNQKMTTKQRKYNWRKGDMKNWRGEML